jgi:hypothetical protein
VPIRGSPVPPEREVAIPVGAEKLPRVALVVANLFVALVSVLQGWGYYQTVVVYWLEALVIGGYNVLRMLVVGFFGERPLGDWLAEHFEVTPSARAFLTVFGTGFFVVKFGGLSLGVGVLVLALPALFAAPGESGAASVFRGLSAAGPGVAIAVAMLALSHGFSFLRNFIGRREYARLTVLGLVFLPYGRMSLVALVLAVGLVIARLVPGAAGATTFAVAMVLAKLAVDIVSHVTEHRWLERVSPSPEP